MKVKIHVTKEILERSKMCGYHDRQEVPFNCAVALAVHDIFKGARVSHYFIHPFGDVHMGHAIELPDEATQFIFEFDKASYSERTTMKPISFEVDIHDSVIETIGISEAKEIIEKSKTLTL